MTTEDARYEWIKFQAKTQNLNFQLKTECVKAKEVALRR